VASAASAAIAAASRLRASEIGVEVRQFAQVRVERDLHADRGEERRGLQEGRVRGSGAQAAGDAE